MAINFNSFTEGTTSNIQSNDYVVGFDNTNPGGERKWQISTIANAVSGITNLNRLSDASSVNGLVKSDGAGNFSAAVAGTDYLTPSSPMSVKAWVVFDGFATFPATLANSGIKAAYNVSSVTEAQLGAYDINFQTPFDTSEYAIAGSACAATPDPAAKRGFYPGGKPTQTTTKCRIETSISGGGTGLSESDRVYVIIFSN